ncbi:MAG: hypothetical protein KDJ24_11215 [Gammaproteobacteria bacterium]|nr:hypothetical protein [Gammaproteobacteria bacterium]
MRIPILLVTILMTAPTMAADNAARGSDTSVSLVPYLWSATFDGTVGAGEGGTDRIDVVSDFGELDIGGFMLAADWRRGAWSVFGDLSYVRVTTDASPRLGLLYRGADAELRGTILQGAVGHTLYADDAATVDLFAGVRYIRVRLDLDVTGNIAPSVSLDATDDWVDGIVGARGAHQVAEHWALGWYGDVGAGGSDLSWQVSAWLAYDAGWGSVVGGWRHLDVDYQKREIRLDAALTGPFLGVAFGF